FDKPSAPSLGAFAERAGELPIGLAALRFGLRIDEVGQTFDGSEVEASVLERPPGEFARLGRPQPLDPPQCGQHRRYPAASAVHLKFAHVLAGLAARSGEP